jgi:hypothetical protein
MCGISQKPDLPASPPSPRPEWVPKDNLSTGAFDLAQSVLPQTVLNHSLRVYLYADWLAQHENPIPIDPSKRALLFVTCILHDIGCTERFNGPQRFEVEGADAAAEYVRRAGLDEADAQQVWRAIALHTSPGIAERIDPFSRLVHYGVLVDFHIRDIHERVDDIFREKVEQSLPRLDIEIVLADAIVDQAMKCPGKAPPASWPGDLLRNRVEKGTRGF